MSPRVVFSFAFEVLLLRFNMDDALAS
jgi:hypothetical protein